MLTSLQSQPVPIFHNLDNLYDFLLFWYGKPCILLGIHVLSKWLPMTNCGCSSHSREFALQLKLAFKKNLKKTEKSGLNMAVLVITQQTCDKKV